MSGHVADVPGPGPKARAPAEWADPFRALVAEVAADPHNPYNIESYLWVLEEPSPRRCIACGELFDPWYGYDGDRDQGLRRLHCSRRCASQMRWARHWARVIQQRWGSAA